MSENRVIRVAIIEDQVHLREGLVTLITGTEGFRCIGSYGSMEEAIPAVRQGLPDILLVDIGLPGQSGIDGIRVLKERYPELLMIVLTVYDDDRRIFDAICAGSRGYLLKKTPPERLMENLREAVNGGAPISPEIALKVITLFREFRPPDNSDYQLTPHENRILKLLTEGHNFKSAAKLLNVSTNTIAFHMRSVYDKLQVHSKSEAVAKALRHGIVR
jgi:DNA-binding NarL/FixJ family response regulator